MVIPNAKNNIIPTKLVSEIWEHPDIATTTGQETKAARLSARLQAYLKEKKKANDKPKLSIVKIHPCL